MKVIKLNRRFKVYRARGHEVAVKFHGYLGKARELELVCRDRLGENFLWNPEGTWYGWYGKKRSGMHHSPYFISFRKESDLTFALMCLTSN
jgi:hypothetical protein